MLVGIATSDDAGVYRLRDDLALVQTVDFFTPIVDDPFDFGRIAAANALSDVYAMGATPVCALNIAAFPIEALGGEILAQILAGGAAMAREAGVAIVGGHTVEDDEPKYGMAVTGTVHPDRIVSNAGARPGDLLFLTKAIGTGVLASALKKDAIDVHAMAPAVASMTTLNEGASAAMVATGVSAATDVAHRLRLARARHRALRARRTWGCASSRRAARSSRACWILSRSASCPAARRRTRPSTPTGVRDVCQGRAGRRALRALRRADVGWFADRGRAGEGRRAARRATRARRDGRGDRIGGRRRGDSDR